MVKAVGAFLVFCCSSGLGLLFAYQCRARPVLLGKLKNVVGLLETEICYAAKPLPQACEEVADRSDGLISELLVYVGDLLKKGETAREAWQRGVSQYLKDTPLTREDISMLLLLGSFIGSSDSEDQQRHLRLLINQFDGQIKEALDLRAKNERMYCYLGILGGLMVILLLI